MSSSRLKDEWNEIPNKLARVRVVCSFFALLQGAQERLRPEATRAAAQPSGGRGERHGQAGTGMAGRSGGAADQAAEAPGGGRVQVRPRLETGHAIRDCAGLCPLAGNRRRRSGECCLPIETWGETN